jgi:hypothetical protein
VCVCVCVCVCVSVSEVPARKRCRILWVTLLKNRYVYLYNFIFSSSDILRIYSSSTSYSVKACLPLPEFSSEPVSVLVFQTM